MPQARLNKSQSKANSRAFLHQPIEFRKVLHLRTDHHSKVSSECASNTPQHKAAPSESHLERIVNLQHPQHTHSHASQRTLSHSHTDHRNNLTPMQPISPAHQESSKKTLLPEPQQRQQTAKSIILQEVPASQQKLPLKQQKEGSHEEQLMRIEQEVGRLVNKKLQVMFQSLHSKRQDHFAARKEQINEELQSLVQEIRQLRSKGSEMQLLNQKIAFIETLMAEQSTEGQLMKKHYYHLSSSKLKGKVGDFNHLRTRVGDAYKSLSHHQGKHKKAKHFLPRNDMKKPLFQQSTNKSAYKSPSKLDYESYRYRQQPVPLNLQPLPRSSYKRDYLVLKSLPDEKIVNRDHSPYYPINKMRVGSIYGQDYKSIKAETINHRELDAFKNKIKTLKVSYMPKNRSDTIVADHKDYYKDVAESAKSRIRSNNSRTNQLSEQELSYNKRTLQSESRRQYVGEKSYEPSRIKNQQLQSFQYKLKNLFKA